MTISLIAAKFEIINRKSVFIGAEVIFFQNLLLFCFLKVYPAFIIAVFSFFNESAIELPIMIMYKKTAAGFLWQPFLNKECLII